MSRPLYYDPTRNVKVVHHYDHTDNVSHVETKTDATPIVEANLRDQTGYGPRDTALGRHVGRVDTVTYAQWQKEARMKGLEPWMDEFKAFVMAKMQSRDYSKLLTWQGATPYRVGYGSNRRRFVL